jgi:hypothetical protein
MKYIKEIPGILSIVIVITIWWYRVFKGSMVFETVYEIIGVLAVGLVIGSLVAGLHVKKKGRRY